MARSETIRRALAFSLLAAGVAAACGGGAEPYSRPDGNPTSIVGIYKLDRVNSKPVPLATDGSHLFINGSLRSW